MNDDSRANHWRNLASEIGAEVSEEKLQAKPAAPKPAAPPAPPVSKRARSKSEGARPTKSHWQRLRSVLGLAGPDEVIPEEPEPEVAKQPVKQPVTGETPAPRAERDRPARDERRPSSRDRSDRESRSRGRGARPEGRRSEERRPEGRSQDERRQDERRPEGRKSDHEREVARDTADDRQLGREAWGEETTPPADVVSFEVRKGSSWRPAKDDELASVEGVGSGDIDYDDDILDQPWTAPASTSESDTEAAGEPREKRGRRARRRRGRGGRRRREEAEAEQDAPAGSREHSHGPNGADELELVEASEPEWIDGDEDDDSTSAPMTPLSGAPVRDTQRRGVRDEPGRSGRPSGTASSIAAQRTDDDDDDDDDDEHDHDEDGDDSRKSHRKIPTWQDAIGHIVNCNMDARKSDRSQSSHRKRRRGGQQRRRGR